MSAPSLKGDGTPEDVWWAPGGLDAVPGPRPGRRAPAGPRRRGRAPSRRRGARRRRHARGLGAGGVEVLVVAVTDGEGSHPDSPTLAPARARRPPGASERRAALEALGIGATVHRLGLPDGGVAADDVAAGSGPCCAPATPSSSPVDGDGHPDHDATARRAARGRPRDAGVGVLALPGVALALGRARARCRSTAPGGCCCPRPPGAPRPTRSAASPPRSPRCRTTPATRRSCSAPVLARFRRDAEIVWGPR